MSNNIIRHGELVLQKISDETVLEGGKAKQNYIASHSETGHHHVIEGDCMVLERPNDTLICLNKPSKVVHKKSFDRHKDLSLDKGIWRSFKKKSRNPVLQVIQEVKD